MADAEVWMKMSIGIDGVGIHHVRNKVSECGGRHKFKDR